VKLLNILTATGLSALLLCVGCDPQDKIVQIFSNQGLTLLKPARSYIALEGIVVLPRKGRMQYIDPYDRLAPSEGTASDFSAVLHQEVDNEATGIQAAVSALAAVVSVPLGLQFDKAQQVQLDEIDSSGTRYASPAIDALLKKQNTSDKIRSLLKPGLGSRVFLVQEIYTAKSLSIKTSSGGDLNASFGGGGKPPTCSTDTAVSKDSSAPATTTPKSPADDENKTTEIEAAAKAVKNAVTTPLSNSNAAAAGTSEAKSGSDGAISVGVCKKTTASLSFTTGSYIPFAVRLNEVEIAPGNILQVKVTDFKVPKTTLGPEEAAATVVINNNAPFLEKIEHITH